MSALAEVSFPSGDLALRADERFPAGPIRHVNPLENAGWDIRLQGCPAATFFHGTAWAKVLQSTYGFAPVYFIAEDSGGLRSLLPVMEVDSWLTGRRGISLPFTDVCEPVCADAGSFGDLWREATEHGQSRAWKYLECRGGKTFLGVPASATFYGHRLFLAGDIGAQFTGIESATRRAIRKAEKNGVSVEFSRELNAVRLFYNLHCRTRHKHGQPPQPFRFFENIYRHVLAQNQGFVALAVYRQRAVAGAIFFHWGKKAIYKYAASDVAFQHVRASNLVIWEAIQWYKHHGFGQLHFGRTSLENEGLRRFKLAWGADEHRIEYVKYDLRAGSFVAGRDESAGWHTDVFRSLPGFCGRLVGTALYKHVA